MTAPTLTLPTPQPRTPSIALPLVLISLGVAFLLANLGALRGLSWSEVFRLWPLLLVLGGVDLLLRPRSFVAAAIVEIAIVAGAFIYLLSGATLGPATLSYSTDVPRAGATDLSLTVNYGAGSLALSGGATALVSVNSTREDVSRKIDQSGTSAAVTISSGADRVFGIDGGDRSWDVKLPSDVRTRLVLNLGAGDFDIDLGAVQVSRATINAGASDLTVRLPVPKGEVPMTIAAGASSVQIDVPDGVAYRISSTGVMQSFSGATQSPGYDTATDRLTIKLSAVASSVTIR
jgi:hypothetical protein